MKPKYCARKKEGALVVLKDVWKIYPLGELEVPALRGICVEIKRGDFVAIVGASGSGKSTMMNLVGCLDTPSKGKVFLKSRNIADLCESDLATLRGKSIGFIFQQYNLLPNMTAYENVIMPLELQEVDDDVAEKQAKKVLKLVGLEDKMHHLPSQLSGGQQQRVAIARCLVGDPEIILADEPTGALDSVTGKDVLNMLERIWKEEGKTVIMVTHDLHLAEYAHKIIELKDGKIIRIEKNHKKVN